MFEGRNEEILAVVILALGIDLAVIADNPVALFFAERRIGQDHVVGFAAVAEQRVARLDRALAAGDVMEIKVHRASPHDLGDNVDAREPRPHRRIDFGIARQRLLAHVLPGREQKPAGAAGRIVDRLPRLGVDHSHHRVDQCARREILPGTRLDLLRVALEQALIDRAFDVDAEPEPGLAVDQPDETPQPRRVLDLVLRLEKNRADMPERRDSFSRIAE